MRIELFCPRCYWRLLLGQRSIDDYDATEYTTCPQCGGNKVVSTIVGQGVGK
jgi:hypothetical protein